MLATQTPLNEQIVFDILDELTDEAEFAIWWWGLPANIREALRQKLEQQTSKNLRDGLPF